MNEINFIVKKMNSTISQETMELWEQQCQQFDAALTLPQEEEWYYHDSMLNDFVYSLHGNRKDRETFNRLIDTGKAVQIAQDMIALYPDNEFKYECGVFIERFATLEEMEAHHTNLQARLRKAIHHTHFLSGEEEESRTYLRKRIKVARSTIRYLNQSNVVTEGNHQFIKKVA